MNINPTLAGLSVAAAAGLVTVPVFAAQLQAEARTSLSGIGFEIYDADLADGLAPKVSFINDGNRWRTLTQAFVGADFDHETAGFMQAFDASRQTDTLATPKGEAFGDAQGASLVATGRALAAGGNYFQGYAGVSSTATLSIEPGFYNMVLGAGTGVRLTGHATAETWLRDSCLATCGFAAAWAQLYASFGPEDPGNPGLPLDPTTLTSDLISYLDEANVTGSGGLIHDSQEADLTLNFENLSGGDLIGRVRWDVVSYGQAPVPEPGTWALLAAGLGLLSALRRRRPTR